MTTTWHWSFSFGADFWCVLVVSQTLLNVDILSTNEYLKDGGWKVAFSTYYALWISERSKHWNCNKKKIFRRYIWCSSFLDSQKLVWQIWSGYQPHSWQLSDIDEDALLAIMENKPEISTEELLRVLKLISQLLFTIWRDLG